MPARTAETRLSTASGQTSASSRWRRLARDDTVATGSQAAIAANASATGGVPETSSMRNPVATPVTTQSSTKPVTDTSDRPARARSCESRVSARGPAGSGRGRANADQTSSSPHPTPSPTSAPISPRPSG